MQNVSGLLPRPAGYDPFKHKWLMALDVDRCIGCGLCVEACCEENSVPEGHWRTWIERYVITKPKPGSGETRGETIVDSPDGGKKGFPELLRSQGGHSQIVLCPQTLQPLRALALHPGLPGRGHLRSPGRRGAGGQELLHRLRFLHPGLPLRMPLFQSRNPHRRQVYPLLPPDYARPQARLRGDLSRRRPGFSAI